VARHSVRTAIDALLALKEAADTARDVGHHATGPEILDKQCRWFREAADTGIVMNAARSSKLHKKQNALATRMRDQADDYLRFAHDLRVPFDNRSAILARILPGPGPPARPRIRSCLG
jgi:transposase